jgi:hypothetical protein
MLQRVKTYLALQKTQVHGRNINGNKVIKCGGNIRRKYADIEQVDPVQLLSYINLCEKTYEDRCEEKAKGKIQNKPLSRLRRFGSSFRYSESHQSCCRQDGVPTKFPRLSDSYVKGPPSPKRCCRRSGPIMKLRHRLV